MYWSAKFLAPHTKRSIVVCKRTNGVWSEPKAASFDSGCDHHDDNPTFTADGKRIYFTSWRPLPGDAKGDDLTSQENIWYVDRSDGGRGEPKPVSQLINAKPLHWGLSVSNSGNLYYSTNKEGLMLSRYVDGKLTKPVKVTEAYHKGYVGLCACIAPDESYILFGASKIAKNKGIFLYAGYRLKDGSWSSPVALGMKIQSSSWANYPKLTADGKYLFLLMPRNREWNVFWVDASVIEKYRPKEK